MSAASSPSPATAETARVVVVGGAGPRVLSSLLWLSLSVATAAVAAIAVVTVQGPGRGWAGLLPGPLPLGGPAVVARRRAEKVQEADRSLTPLIRSEQSWNI